jgi:hypothetical protein
MRKRGDEVWYRYGDLPRAAASPGMHVRDGMDAMLGAGGVLRVSAATDRHLLGTTPDGAVIQYVSIEIVTSTTGAGLNAIAWRRLDEEKKKPDSPRNE